MTGLPTLFAALLLGLAASGHCVLMCGGISAALGLATAKDAHGRTRRSLLLGYQFGRVFSYVLAGLLFGGLFGGLIAVLDVEAVRRGLRIIGGIVLLLAAAIAFGLLRDTGFGLGNRLWSKLAPLGRRLLPVATLPRAFAFGMVWGWMPCGFVYTVLLIATMALDPLAAAATMAAFGLGTVPAMAATAFGAPKLGRWMARTGVRRAAGVVLLISAALTFAGPWLPLHQWPWLQAWLPFGCALPPGSH